MPVIPALGRLKQENPRPAWTTEQDPVSKKLNKEVYNILNDN
jgi:hypothetical protein